MQPRPSDASYQYPYGRGEDNLRKTPCSGNKPARLTGKHLGQSPAPSGNRKDPVQLTPSGGFVISMTETGDRVMSKPAADDAELENLWHCFQAVRKTALESEERAKISEKRVQNAVEGVVKGLQRMRSDMDRRFSEVNEDRHKIVEAAAEDARALKLENAALRNRLHAVENRDLVCYDSHGKNLFMVALAVTQLALAFFMVWGFFLK